MLLILKLLFPGSTHNGSRENLSWLSWACLDQNPLVPQGCETFSFQKWISYYLLSTEKKIQSKYLLSFLFVFVLKEMWDPIPQGRLWRHLSQTAEQTVCFHFFERAGKGKAVWSLNTFRHSAQWLALWKFVQSALEGQVKHTGRVGFSQSETQSHAFYITWSGCHKRTPQIAKV